ncbi:MAG: bifunctional metallophosphatase/5'-nucleotidase, partial [Anaerolineae bacterium]
GNHELDYGLPHLLFLEKVATFPIVNANLYIRKYLRRLMRPYIILEKAGLHILVTGVITEKIMDTLRQDNLIGSFVTLEEASQAIGAICNAYKHDDIDLTIVLTHIGLESDIQLASMLDPEWGVDMIIGGHSHSVLDEPLRVNNILIAQAGVGTNQIGRFDITVDDDTNAIVDYSWQLVPIREELAEPDPDLLAVIEEYKTRVDEKFGAVLCMFTRPLTHPKREVETELGNLFADIFAENAECDVMLLGSGSIRSERLGPAVTLGGLRACFPYDDKILRGTLTGAQLRRLFSHIMRPENRTGEGECYQVNRGVEAVYDDDARRLVSLKVRGQPVQEDQLYRVALQSFHYSNCSTYLNIRSEELSQAAGLKVVTTSAQQVLEEYFRTHQNLSAKVEGRLAYI